MSEDPHHLLDSRGRAPRETAPHDVVEHDAAEHPSVERHHNDNRGATINQQIIVNGNATFGSRPSGAEGVANLCRQEDTTLTRLRTIPSRSLRRLPQRTGTIIERPKLSDTIAATLQGPDDSVVLVGPPGSGKTWLATGYADANRERYDIVWFVTATDETQIRKGLTALGRELGIADHVTPAELLQATSAWLRLREGWLLLLDSAEDMDAIERLIPLTGPGHVVITTTSPTSTPKWLPSISVTPLPTDRAAFLLRELAGWTPQTSVGEILERLGTLPCSVDRAGRLARLAELDPPGLLEQLQIDGAEASNIIQYLRKALVGQLPAQTLLCMCAFFGPAPIPLSLFRAPGLEHLGPMAERLPRGPVLADAVRCLVDLGLATTLPGTLSLDPQIANVVILMLGKHRQAWEDLALNIATVLYQHGGLVNRDHDVPDATFVSVVRHVVKNTEPTPERVIPLTRLYVFSSVAYDHYSGQPALAVREIDRAIAIVERHSPESAEVLAGMYHNAGCFRMEQGDFEHALPSFVHAKELLDGTPGANVELLAVTTLYLARTHADCKQPDEAIVRGREYLTLIRDGGGVPHTDLVRFVTELLRCTSDSSRVLEVTLEAFTLLRARGAPEARSAGAQVALGLAATLAGGEHHSVSARLLELGLELVVAKEIGERLHTLLGAAASFRVRSHLDEEALLLQHASVLMRDEALPASERGSYWADYASKLFECGEPEPAAQYQRRVLDELESTPGADPVSIAWVLADLSCSLYFMDRAREARALYEARIDSDAATADIATCLLTLGLARLRWAASDPEALETYERTAALFTHVMGPADPGTVLVRAELATELMAKDDMVSALPHAAAVADQLLALPSAAPGAQASSLEHVARIQLAISDTAGACSTVKRMLRLLESRPPLEEEDTKIASDVMGRVAVALAERGFYTEALRAGTKGFELHRRIQVKPSAHTLGLANNIGLMLEYAGRPSAAILWFEQAAKHAEAIGDQDWHDVSCKNALRARAQNET